jgi:RNA-directed DNA polymerase
MASVDETAIGSDGSESPVTHEQLMEEVVRKDNILRAVERVVRNRGSAGVDGMRVEELRAHLREHWKTLRDQLLAGSYQPQPVRRVEIPKPDGGVRKLGIPTVVDRFVQQALLQVLQERWDPTFSEHSYGFRPGRKAHQAIAQAQKYMQERYRWVVDIDLEKFFDRVNHDVLMNKVEKRVSDKRVIGLIRSYLRAGILDNGVVTPPTEGTPQGGPLSPLLSNLLLDELDRELERRGHRFARYADDCNIYVRTRAAGNRVMKSITRFLAKKLKLQVNAAKSAVDRPWKRKFLGFTLTSRTPKRAIAEEPVRRFKNRVRAITSRTRGVSFERVVQDLKRYLTGWCCYFGYCEQRTVLGHLESWLHRRLRSLLWKQWGKGRYRELRRRGISLVMAKRMIGSGHGPWRLSRSPALSFAIPGKYFDSLGIPRLNAIVIT